MSAPCSDGEYGIFWSRPYLLFQSNGGEYSQTRLWAGAICELRKK